MMLVRLSDHLPLRITEWLVSGILLTWGVYCLNAPASIWDDPVNWQIAEFGSQGFWGSYAFVLGLVRMAALFINGALRRSPHARAIGAFLSLLIWVQMTLGLLTAQWMGLAAIIYPWLCIADFYNVFRAAQDARISDERARFHPGAVRDASSA